MMARIPISTTTAFCLIYIAAYLVAAESDVDWSPKYTVPKSVDEKLYDMAFTENEKVQREAMEDEERLATTEDPDAANDKRIRIQMYSRDIGEPTMYQDGALNKRMRLQSMKKRIRLQSLKKRDDDTADVWEPEKRMRLQSLKRAFCGSYEMPPETEENDQDQTADQEQTSEEKRMRLQSLQKRMRLQSLKRGDEIADVWEPEKRMRLQSLKRAFCGSYEMPPETEDNDQDQTADQQQTSEEDKRMRLQSLQKRMRLQSLQKRMRLQSLQKRMRLQSMSKRMRLQSL
ncbi:uncharacterized protein LOC142344442 [Convolutriloba macropyga]|uniref:uncharacterized protein LOC142344442 n=1 Tax=Convolutriloba macropyga TaxID=536237 RepID=UPI003F52563B